MTDVNQLVQRLAKWYWSPQYPTTYTLSNGAGLGRIALSDPAAFNLTWQKYQGNFGSHAEAVAFFALAGSRLNGTTINREPLSGYITLYSTQEFGKFYNSVRTQLPRPVTHLVDQAFNAQVL